VRERPGAGGGREELQPGVVARVHQPAPAARRLRHQAVLAQRGRAERGAQLQKGGQAAGEQRAQALLRSRRRVCPERGQQRAAARQPGQAGQRQAAAGHLTACRAGRHVPAQAVQHQQHGFVEGGGRPAVARLRAAWGREVGAAAALGQLHAREQEAGGEERQGERMQASLRAVKSRK